MRTPTQTFLTSSSRTVVRVVRVLLIGDTGRGKTVTSLSVSKNFKTLYYDVDLGTDLWLQSLGITGKNNIRILKIRDWEDYKKFDLQRLAGKQRPQLVVIDSISELYDKYKDYVQRYVRETGKFPMPVATGVVDLTKKGINTEFITLPMQLYALLYDTIVNVVTAATSYSEHTIITMHPLETRMVAHRPDGSSEIVHSSAKLGFLQSIYRKVDVIIKLPKPMQGQVVKSRGDLKPVDELVDPIEFILKKMGVGGDEDVQ